jgi:hypothetical protein
METEEILRHIEKYWDLAIENLHRTAPKDKNLPTTSGQIEEQMDNLYKKHKENLKEIFIKLQEGNN